MDKKTAGLIGAVAGLATMSVAHAATTPAVSPTQALQASSYADLLEPIPNASALLRADDAAQAPQPLNTAASFQLADWRGGYDNGYRRDHHHHHQAYRNYGYYNRDNHHHHHHHNYNGGTYVGVPGVGGVMVGNGRD